MISLSIVVPAYNAEKLITETLKPLAGIDSCSYEILLIDDGSSDNTVEEVKTFVNKEKISSLRIISRSNKGVSASRNEGLHYSKGDYILFLDADDILDISDLASKIEFLRSNPDYIGVTSNAMDIDYKGTMGKMRRGIYELKQILNSSTGFNSCPSGYLWQRAYLNKYDLSFNEKLQSSADKYFLISVLLKGKIGYLNDSLFFYRVHSQSMSQRISAGLVQDKIQYIQEIKTMFENSKVERSIYRDYITRQYFTIAGLNKALGHYFDLLKYLIRAFIRNPKLTLHLLSN